MGVVSSQRRAVVRRPERLSATEFPVRRWPERRIVVLAAASLLGIGVFAASMVSANALDQLSVLYVLPVMLIGLELGASGGAGAAAVAFVLLFAASRSHPELGAPGLAASGTVFLAAGALAGRFSERMRAGHRQQERLLASGLRLARLEDHDTLPVHAAPARGSAQHRPRDPERPPPARRQRAPTVA